MMENEVFLSFTFYSTILIVKMYVVAIITGQVRLRKKCLEKFPVIQHFKFGSLLPIQPVVS